MVAFLGATVALAQWTTLSRPAGATGDLARVPAPERGSPLGARRGAGRACLNRRWSRRSSRAVLRDPGGDVGAEACESFALVDRGRRASAASRASAGPGVWPGLRRADGVGDLRHVVGERLERVADVAGRRSDANSFRSSASFSRFCEFAPRSVPPRISGSRPARSLAVLRCEATALGRRRGRRLAVVGVASVVASVVAARSSWPPWSSRTRPWCCCCRRRSPPRRSRARQGEAEATGSGSLGQAPRGHGRHDLRADQPHHVEIGVVEMLEEDALDAGVRVCAAAVRRPRRPSRQDVLLLEQRRRDRRRGRSARLPARPRSIDLRRGRGRRQQPVISENGIGSRPSSLARRATRAPAARRTRPTARTVELYSSA